MAARCRPEELRWMCTRKTAMLREYLESRPPEEPLVVSGPMLVRKHLWRRLQEGRINLRTMAEYEAALKRELECLMCEVKETGTDGGLLRRLSTLVRPNQARPMAEEELVVLLDEFEDGPASLLAGLWLAAGRKAEVMASLARDVNLEVVERETFLSWALRRKGGQTDWATPLSLKIKDLDPVRTRCVGLVFGRAEDVENTRGRDAPLWGPEDWRQLSAVPTIQAYSCRRGRAQQAAQEMRVLTVVKDVLRQKTTSSTPRYLARN